MTSEKIFLHDCVILDANCLINLYASGHMSDILGVLPGTVAAADYVLEKEVIWIYNGSEQEKQSIELQPLIESELLTLVSLKSEAEDIAFIDFAAAIGDDGESITGAIASHRNWAIGIDDRKAIKVFSDEIPNTQLITTPEFIKYWADTAAPGTDVIRMTLQNIRIRAKYEPSQTHPLYSWWQRFNGNHLN